MQFSEIAAFEVAHGHLPWPWIAFDAGRRRFAFVTADGRVATRALDGERVVEGPSFALPADLPLPEERAADDRSAVPEGLRGLAVDPSGARVALTGVVSGASFVVTLDAGGERRRSALSALAEGGLTAHAVAFDRSGDRLWVSAESSDATALVLLDASSHEVLGVVRSAAFPPPALHELHVHPQDDAVLLLAACGEGGTFARVAGWSDGPPILLPTALDAGSVSAGFVGFSADGARVHLVEADELRTHAWPGLEELSTVELADDFVSSYAGAVLGDRILVDGEEAESGEDAVMTFDRSAIRGARVKPPVPGGMWVGRIGPEAIVTVESKGDPARGRVLRLPAPKS